MSFALSVADWMTMVQLIYRLNCIEGFLQYQSKTLEIIKTIVPFHSGVFNLAGQQQDHIMTGNLCGYNLSEKELFDLTENGLKNNAFLKSLLLDPSGLVSRGPDLSQFRETDMDFINARLIPQGEQRALSMVLNYKDNLLGYIILFRDDQAAEFNTRDICILGNLKNHIALQLYKLSNSYVDMNQLENRKFLLEKKLTQYGLSKRELEILALIQSGKSDVEICEQLFITSSTFKKHLNHIYEKMKVNSRLRLIKLVDSECAE